jgi:hypothetical protein
MRSWFVTGRTARASRTPARALVAASAPIRISDALRQLALLFQLGDFLAYFAAGAAQEGGDLRNVITKPDAISEVEQLHLGPRLACVQVGAGFDVIAHARLTRPRDFGPICAQIPDKSPLRERMLSWVTAAPPRGPTPCFRHSHIARAGALQ